MASFSSTSPHFFAIVFQQTLLNNKLKIPNKIVRKCGSGLGDDVLLKLPCGSEWKLGLTKSSEGRVYIDKGWVEFSKHYSIGLGHLLVLRYDGNSRFNVVIFDPTTTEIDYPLKNQNESETQNRNKRVKEEVKEEIEKGGDEDYNPSEPCSRPRKRTRKCRFNGEFCDLRGEDANPQRSEGMASPNSRSKAKRQGKMATSNAASPRLNMDERAQGLERVSGFESTHPFFVVVIRPINTQTKYSLNLPLNFARSYLNESKRVVLKVEDRRAWLVEYRTSTVLRKYSMPRFATGWFSFARENGLKSGDACVFVMTKTVPRVSFEVSFFRKNGVANSPSVRAPEKRTSLSRRSKSVHAAKREASGFDQNPSFAVYMSNSYINKGCPLRIPATFARNYMNRNRSKIRFRVSDGRSWSVRYRKDSFTISNGWSEFKRENCLEEGDICTFELSNKVEMSFEVSIVKPTHKGYEQIHKALLLSRTKPSQPQKHSKAKTRPKLSGKFGEVKSEVANEFGSENPYFRVDFPSSHLNKTLLRVPVNFGRRYLKKKTQIVTLQVGENSWPVTLLFSHPSKYDFSGGWSAFRKENPFHPGDVCVFELIKTNQVVFKVSIFHKSC